MKMQREDLRSSHYDWDSEKDIFQGSPTRRSFNTSNGYQVLFLINSYGEMMEEFTLEDALKLEQKLLNELPLAPLSEISALQWLGNNLKTSCPL